MKPPRQNRQPEIVKVGGGGDTRDERSLKGDVIRRSQETIAENSKKNCFVTTAWIKECVNGYE